jgi:cytochrome c biogenesis protein CcmG, thiol:disulfide interchange protein DsbE
MLAPSTRRAVRACPLALAVAFAGCASTTGQRQPAGPLPTKAQARAALRTLHVQANALLDGGVAAFERRLASLRGYPIVVNQWASWCGPCRFEFPFFQHLAQKYDGRVAFLGVDSEDARADARGFLKRFPVPYPHFFDPDKSVARAFRGGQAWPTTAFYSAAGKRVYVHPGAYAAEHVLDASIRRYAVDG